MTETRRVSGRSAARIESADTAPLLSGATSVTVKPWAASCSSGSSTPNGETIRRLPNLIAETSWVSPEGILETMDILGSERTLYGTDATVDGHAQYERHSVPNCYGHFIYRLPDVVAAVKAKAKPADFANWARLNAIRLYGLRLAPVMAMRQPEAGKATPAASAMISESRPR